MMNGSVWRGYISQHCKPSRIKGKNISVLKQSWFMLLENQKELPSLSDKRKWRKGEISDISECDVSMEIVYASAIVQIWSEPSKLQTFNNRAYVERHFLTLSRAWYRIPLRPDLGFLSWAKFDTFNPRETWCFSWLSNHGSKVNTHP